MKLVVGGAYQGKKAFVNESLLADKENGKEHITIVDGAVCNLDDICEAQVVDQLHEMIRRSLQQDIEPMDWIQAMIERNPEIILICNEVGCGLVPIEAFDRKYREKVGRIQCELAKSANCVYRVYSGVGVKIK